jgi:methionine aminotransferase
VYDGRSPVSVLGNDELREKSFAVFSFGKTLHATGIRVGYCVAPPELTRELRKVHQFNTFSIATATQYAIAKFLAEKPNAGRDLAPFFQAKRDRLRAALAGTAFRLPPAQGTYFQLMDYSALSDEEDVKFVDRLLNEAGVATIPLSPFYKEPPALRVVRLCIAKRDDTIDAAAARLRAFADRLAKGTRQ